jgi:two-component system OmpR family response regulator
MTPIRKPRILVIEDDREISRLLIDLLAENGFAAKAAENAREMDAALQRDDPDLVLLDVMLPGEDGFSICRRLRSASRKPIIMLTARGEDSDRIIGLELGADDYVCKPFNPRELVARIRALLRRAYDGTFTPGSGGTTLRFAGWRVDSLRRQVHNSEGIRVAFTSGEFDLLLAFCRNPGRVLSREELLEVTHLGAAGPIERSIDVHISRIRQKLEPDPKDPVFITTVRLGGYVFTPPVESL